MKKNDRKVLLLLITLPLYFFLLWVISKPFLGQFFFNKKTEKGFLSAIHYDTRNASYHYILGRFYHYNSKQPDPSNAIRYYESSISLNPLQGGCWLDLAKAYQAAGLIAEAGNAIERAIRLIPKNPAVMWEAGIFYLVNNEIERAIESFREFIILRPQRQEEVYDMLWKIPLESQYLLNKLVPNSYPYYKRYLLYLISTDRINETKKIWNAMKGLTIEDEVFLHYIEFLISRHLYNDAKNIWEDFIKEKFKEKKEGWSSLIWNGSFENDIMNGGFDWKIRETDGVDVFLDRDIRLLGERSIGVTFDGLHNPDITIASQVVRVVPGAKYFFRGNIKTDSLTTTNGLFFLITGHDCKNLHKRSEVTTGTNFWKEVSMELDIPAGCNAILISIKRERSTKFDNKISGSAWIDGISLTQR
ncbi:MAG: hypothetical protein AB1610_11430 [Nitrospirota bacterium]